MRPQESLFSDSPYPDRQARKRSPRDVRKDAQDAAFKNADEKFKAQYEGFVIKYAQDHGEFTAEDCQLAYKQTPNPQPREWRASGGIFVRLVNRGILKRCGTGWSGIRGVPIPKYCRG